MSIISVVDDVTTPRLEGCPRWCVEHNLDEGVRFGPDVTVELVDDSRPQGRRTRTLSVHRY